MESLPRKNNVNMFHSNRAGAWVWVQGGMAGCDEGVGAVEGCVQR